jgi:hypothetical protein
MFQGPFLWNCALFSYRDGTWVLRNIPNSVINILKKIEIEKGQTQIALPFRKG